MKKPLRILVVEDSEDDAFLVLHQMKKGNYDVYYERVETAEAMSISLTEKNWDIVLSDYAMPHFNGIEALSLLKKSGIDLPFIIISGTIGEEVAVEAMKFGAHDYLMKNNLQRLLPAVEREIRESESRAERRLFELKKKEAEEALRESEKRYRRITEGLTDYLYTVLIENGQVVETIQGEACVAVTGYTAEEFANDPFLWFRMVVSDDRDNVKEQIRLILSGIEVQPIEHRIQCKNGTIKWVCNTTILIKDTEGKLLSYDGVIKDITERKLAEYELRKLSRAVEQSPVSIAITNIDGRIEYVNPKFSEVTGYSKDEAIGQNPRILKSGEMPAENYAQLWQTITSGKEWYGEFHNKKKNGELFWELASISPIVNTAGKITHFLAIKEDITSRKLAEQALFESERKYRVVADNTFNWEFWTDSQDKFIYCSPSCIRVSGYSESEFIEDPDLKYKIIHPDYYALFYEHAHRSSNEKVAVSLQYKIVHKDGSERWIEHVCQPVFDNADNFMGFRGSNCDITEKKETDRKILNAIITTEESERNKFSQELHDGLGPMLSTVKLYFQWLSETIEADKKKSITQTGIQNIDDAIQSIKEISNNLSPRILINMGLIPALKYLIHQINETQKLSIVFNFYNEMRYNQQIEITIYRIISELLNNTLKYAQAKNVDITISYNNINNHLIITYADDGKGFDFNQVIENKKGMGINNMMQRISTLKGFINFNTKEGKSLQVRIELPL